MVKQVFAWGFVAVFAVLVTVDAYALTLRSGEVLTAEGVVHASESETTRTMIERDGYAVAGGQVHLGANDVVVSIDISELSGKSKDRIVALVGEKLASAIGDDLDRVSQEIGDAVAQEAYDVANNIDDLAEQLGGEFADNFHDAYQAAIDLAEQTGDWTEVDRINAEWDAQG